MGWRERDYARKNLRRTERADHRRTKQAVNRAIYTHGYHPEPTDRWQDWTERLAMLGLGIGLAFFLLLVVLLLIHWLF
jgi:hypothetical protein